MFEEVRVGRSIRTRALALVAGAAVMMAGLVGSPAPAAAIEQPSTPYTFGSNSFGELGNGTTTARRTAGPVTGLTDVVDIHGGREHVIVLRADGTVWTWGSNVEGQLGIGTTGNRSLPVQVPGLTGVVAVETGHNFSMALRSDGTVWQWGLNADGQLGDGTTTLRRSPVQVVGLTDAVAIAGGRNMSYAIRANGQVMAWGRNDEGQLGDGTTTRRLTPVRVGSLTGVQRIAGGRDHGLAVLANGSVWAWGSNNYGQIGDGTTTDRTAPVQVIASGVADVAGGAHHSYALRTAGTVASWGRNYRANLGDGTTTQRTRPVTVLDVAGAVSIGSARDAGVVTLSDGRALAWGDNAGGQLGDGTTTQRTRAVVVQGVDRAVKAAGGGAAYSVILQRDGTPPPDQDPVARITGSCVFLSCPLTGATSSDADGTIQLYEWDFGDGTTATGVAPGHTYAEAGTYPVTLTVTDDDGDSGSASASVTVAPAPPVSTAFRSAASAYANSSAPSVVVPTTVQNGDRLLLFVSTNSTTTAAAPAGWTQLSTAIDGSDMRSTVFTRSAAADTAGSRVTVGLGAQVKASLALSAYSGAGAPTVFAVTAEAAASPTSHTAPSVDVTVAGSIVVRHWSDKVSTAHTWTVPAEVTLRTSTNGSGSGMITAALADSIAGASGASGTSVGTAGVASGKAISWSVVIPPALSIGRCWTTSSGSSATSRSSARMTWTARPSRAHPSRAATASVSWSATNVMFLPKTPTAQTRRGRAYKGPGLDRSGAG